MGAGSFLVAEINALGGTPQYPAGCIRIFHRYMITGGIYLGGLFKIIKLWSTHTYSGGGVLFGFAVVRRSEMKTPKS